MDVTEFFTRYIVFILAAGFLVVLIFGIYATWGYTQDHKKPPATGNSTTYTIRLRKTNIAAPLFLGLVLLALALFPLMVFKDLSVGIIIHICLFGVLSIVSFLFTVKYTRWKIAVSHDEIILHSGWGNKKRYLFSDIAYVEETIGVNSNRRPMNYYFIYVGETPALTHKAFIVYDYMHNVAPFINRLKKDGKVRVWNR